MGAALGALRNRLYAQVIGWPGPSGGYYDSGKHPLHLWLQPARMTTDGNLP
jgi:hypothetical protein